MFRNYFVTAKRSLVKNKSFAILNILGLSIGIAATLLLSLFVRYELSYDQFYEDEGRIYRLFQEFKFDNFEREGITGSGLLAPALKENFSEIEVAGRLHDLGQTLLSIEERKFNETNLKFADPELLEIFEVPFLEGSKKDALLEPYSIVLTESLAAKLFDIEEDKIGKTISLGRTLMNVTGIIPDLPKNSHLSASGFISIKSLGQLSWGRMGTVTYVRLLDAGQRQDVEHKIPEMIYSVTNSGPGSPKLKMSLFPVSDIYLTTDKKQLGEGNKFVVVSLTIIAIFILLIAIINYMNMATAQSIRRIKEIGIRKIIGASKKHFILQFLIESTMISVIAVLIGGFIAEMSSAYFNELIGKNIGIEVLSDPATVSILLLASLGLGIFTGIYPALYLSSFRMSDVLNGGKSGGKRNQNLRRFLVTFQFIISITLIISTLVVYRQLNYLNNKDLGFNQEHVLSIKLPKRDPNNILKGKLLQLPGVQSISATNLLPASGDPGSTFEIRNEDGETSSDIISMASIDYDYLNMMEMTLVSGRNFSEEIVTDKKGVIVNETLAKKYEWKSAIGQKLEMNNEDEGIKGTYTVIGVTSDFNMLSLYEPIKPFAFFLKPEFDWGSQYLLLRLNSQNINETVDAVKAEYNLMLKDFPINTQFLDDYFGRVYSSETQRGEVYLLFSILTVVIACVGLFGLAAFILQQRTKEISIRKVLGATLNDLIGLISKEFVAIIIIATVIATPLAYLFSQSWLNSFEYAIAMKIDSVIIGGLLALILAISTIGFQSLRTARKNPSETLKYD